MGGYKKMLYVTAIMTAIILALVVIVVIVVYLHSRFTPDYFECLANNAISNELTTILNRLNSSAETRKGGQALECILNNLGISFTPSVCRF